MPDDTFPRNPDHAFDDPLDQVIEALCAVAPVMDVTCIAETVWLAAKLAPDSVAPPIRDDFPAEGDIPEEAVSQAGHNPLQAIRSHTQHAGIGKPVTASRRGLYEPASSSNRAGIPGQAIRIPQGRALPRALEIARSMRPFKQPWLTGRRSQLDLKATIDEYSRSLELIPAFRPAPERWFELVVVVDRSISMTIWEETITEFTQVLRGTGAFRKLHIWNMDSGQDRILLNGPLGQTMIPQQMNSSDGRRLALVVSDCSSEGWRSGLAWALIRQWARTVPIALVNPLPPKLWRRTGLDMPAVRVGPPDASGARNSALSHEIPFMFRTAVGSYEEWTLLPALAMTPYSLARWARTLMRIDRRGCDAVIVPNQELLDELEILGENSGLGQGMQVLTGGDTFSQGNSIIDDFLHIASREAVRLAVLCAPYQQVSLPLLRLIRDELVPEATASDEAEVILSGLFTVSSAQSGTASLQFREGTRSELKEMLSAHDAWLLHDALSRRIARQAATGMSFPAVAQDSHGDLALPSDAESFAEASIETLRLLGVVTDDVATGSVSDSSAAFGANELSSSTSSQALEVPSAFENSPILEALNSQDWESNTDSGGGAEDRIDFFISHAESDRAWAEWVAWQLTDAGYTVELDVWHWAAGSNLVTALSDALGRCDRIVALFSTAYLDRSRYTTEEWMAALVHLPGTAEGRLVPVRVEQIPVRDMPAVLRPLMFCDLFGLDAIQARRVLLEAVRGPRRPDGEPIFPGRGSADGLGESEGSEPRLPGRVPRVWNFPARNPGFTGRDGLLLAIRERLVAGHRTVMQALCGMVGVGKTQLAIEYAYRFAGTYDLAWWISSEQPGLIGDQIAALGAVLGCVQAGDGMEVARAAVLAELRGRGRWLLVFDNAENPADIAGWLPGGTGHVLITSRERRWTEIAAPVEVDVLARSESMAILQGRVSGLSEADAGRLALELGDLPLALVQAAGFMAETGTPAAQYLRLLRTRAGQLLAQGAPGSYPRSLAAATHLIADRLSQEDPAAADLAILCAFLAPEPIPEALFTNAASNLPSELAARMADPLAWRQTVGRIARQSLARIDHRGLVMHRLTQAILRDRLAPEQVAATHARVEVILAASNPGDASNPTTWPRWTTLMPHLLALDPAASAETAIRELACGAAWYLLVRGDTGTSYDLASHLYQQWRERLGPDDHYSLWAAGIVGSTLRQMGRYREARQLDEDAYARNRRLHSDDNATTLYSAGSLAADLRALGEVQAARDLDEDTLARRRRVLGDDHPETLASASNLAADLRVAGEVQAARDLDEDTLARRRRVLGDDHPETLASASNLAADLRVAGEVQAARDLDEDTLARRRRVLGDDHPETLASASNLAADLRVAGEVQAARDLDEDTLARRRRVLGDDHPETLASASNLAADLRVAGEVQAARDLDEDTLARRRRVLGDEHPEAKLGDDSLTQARRKEDTRSAVRPVTGLLDLASRAQRQLQNALAALQGAVRAMDQIEHSSAVPDRMNDLSYEDQQSLHEQLAASVTDLAEDLVSCSQQTVERLTDAEVSVFQLSSPRFAMHAELLAPIVRMVSELKELSEELLQRMTQARDELDTRTGLCSAYRLSCEALSLAYDSLDHTSGIAISLSEGLDRLVADKPIESGKSDVRLVPVLGNAAAGVPILAGGEDVEYLPVSSQYTDQDTFAIKVRGDSMAGDGVLDGDYVIVTRDTDPKDGDVVVVLAEGEEDEATVKRLRRVGADIHLESSNPAYEPIIFRQGDRPIIQGKVIGVVRQHPLPADKPIESGKSDVRLVPVLGNAAAGVPILAGGEDVEYLPVSSQYTDQDTFAIKVRGDSMAGDGVLDGDYVIVTRDTDPKDGDVVVVLAEGEEDEATVKRLRRVGADIHLESSNPAYEPIIFRQGDRPIIQGKVIGVIRQHIA